ncbi:uncharacterized protein LOC133890322 [Phragmites australis]|uniref:uncharacterized protein LOC133890322 n=1 Tax=Phragmites australis TaxID=29695 RepID=UPI002D775FFD|nr:uncharacterized protein LOC133890322 [Phragmites australis]
MAKIKKNALICCCVLLAVVVVLAVTLVALYFTVLRGGPPRVAATAVDTRLNTFEVLPPELNLSLAVEVTLHNPNHARFRYGEVVTTVTYHNTTVGQSTAPAGEIQARSMATVGAAGQVDAKKVILHNLYALDVLTGALPFQAATSVAGNAAVLRPFRVSAASQVACNVVVYPFKRESSSHCTSTVRAT